MNKNKNIALDDDIADIEHEEVSDYFNDNPNLVCKCGRKFRRKTTTNQGIEHINTECINCHIENWKARQVSMRISATT